MNQTRQKVNIRQLAGGCRPQGGGVPVILHVCHFDSTWVCQSQRSDCSSSVAAHSHDPPRATARPPLYFESGLSGLSEKQKARCLAHTGFLNSGLSTGPPSSPMRTIPVDFTLQVPPKKYLALKVTPSGPTLKYSGIIKNKAGVILKKYIW